MEILAAQRLGDRSEQQDAFAFAQKERTMILIVADGLGGHSGGAEAADFVARRCLSILSDDTLILSKDSLKVAYEQLYKAFCDSGLEGQTTLACAVLEQDKDICWTMHIGDSRIYQLGRRSWHSKDHSIVQLLIDDEEMSEQAALEHEHRSALYKSLSAKKKHRPRIGCRAVSNGDLILVCTDGFWSSVDVPQMEKLGRSWSQDTLDKLTDKVVNNHGKSDNVTVIATLVKQ